MPTLPLMDPPDAARAIWHRVQRPGGYESWHLQANDQEHGIHLLATFYQGNPFHPDYLKRYQAYLRRPTRNAPPLPAEYPCVELGIYQHGHPLAHSITQFPPTAFTASSQKRSISIGTSQLEYAGHEIALHVQGPDTLSVNLLFRPRQLPEGTELLDDISTSDEKHFWMIDPSVCDVGGEIRGATPDASNTIPVVGRGYHEHRFGAEPIGYNLIRWMRGTILMEGHTAAFAIGQPRNSTESLQSEWFLADQKHPTRVRHDAATTRNERSNLLGQTYPQDVDIADAIVLRQPRIIGRTLASLILEYDAFVHQEPAKALCEIVYPRRIRSLLIGGMIERDIRRHESLR